MPSLSTAIQQRKAPRWLLAILAAAGIQALDEGARGEGRGAREDRKTDGIPSSLAPRPSPLAPSLQVQAAQPENLPRPRTVPPTQNASVPPDSPEILEAIFEPIDLASALRLAGVQNPQILLAQQRIAEARALRLAAISQVLPTINTGTNIDVHNGPLQQSSGTILKVNRSALYAGLGANAIAAGTVNIPGIYLAGNLSEALFGALASRQVVRASVANAAAVRNRILLDVTGAYISLLRAEGDRAIVLKTREETREVARVTANYAAKIIGQGRKADADRAATTLDERNVDLLQADSAILAASARLAELLGLDPSVRLHAIDGWVVPTPIVPDDTPLAKLIAIALDNRPELAAQRATIEAALLRLRQAQLLPFAPTFIAGYSAGQFGGGSNLISRGLPLGNGTVLQQHRFDNFGGRQDIDVIVYWSLRNMGVGNIALTRVAGANVGIENYRLAETINRIRTEVATAYARVHARFAQFDVAERAVRTSTAGYKEDFERTFNNIGLPIEVLDSLRLLYRSRNAYLAAILEYNRAQFELYVALGQPPPAVFAQPIPAKLVPAPQPAIQPVPGGMVPQVPCPPGQAQQPHAGQWAAGRRQ